MNGRARPGWTLVLGTLLGAAVAGACLGDWGFDAPFPCRAPEDCVEGYECAEGRWVCVPVGTSTTTSTVP